MSTVDNITEDDTDAGGADEELDLHTQFKAWKTCREMIYDRGYNIDDEYIKDSQDYDEGAFTFVAESEQEQEQEQKVLENTYENFTALFHLDKHQNIFASKEGAKDIKVCFCNHATITPKAFFNTTKKDYGANDIIIFVIQNKITKQHQNHVIFRYSEMIFNRTHHRLVPKHELLTEAEKKDVLMAYDCKDSQLPRMALDDFVCRYYGGVSGDVFRIHRPSPSCGTYITYRVVK